MAEHEQHKFTLSILRHAKADRDDPNLDDKVRALTGRGRTIAR